MSLSDANEIRQGDPASSPAWLARLDEKFRSQAGPGGEANRARWLQNAATALATQSVTYFRRAHAHFPDLVYGSVLDAGCGDGCLAIRFALEGATVVGIEIDCEYVEIARLRLDDLPPVRALFLCGDLTDPSTLNGMSFDLIMSIDVIEHVPDAKAYLRNLRTHLKPGGRIWLFTPQRFAACNIVADPHYKIPGLTILPNSWAAWYALRGSRRTKVYDVARLYTPLSLRRTVRKCGLTMSFVARQTWKDALIKRRWLARIGRIPLIGEFLFWIYLSQRRTLEVILSPL